MRYEPHIKRLGFLLVVRGAMLIPFAALAVRWPDRFLLLGLVAAGAMAGSLGIFELAAATVSDELPSTKLFLVAHALTNVLFGVLTACLPVVSLASARFFSALWLVAYAAFLFVVAARVWFVSAHARNVLLAWSAANVGFVLAVLLVPVGTLNGLLYDAAAYAFALGIVQVIAGRWIEITFEAPKPELSTG